MTSASDKAGNDGDIAALVAEHAAWLSAFVRGLTRSEADAEDAFQDVWMRILRAGGLPAGASVRAYLARTARSAVIDRHRRADRAELVLDAADATGSTPAESLPAATTPPAERVTADDLHSRVLAAVRALPRGPRETALLRIEGELTFQEIADTLAVPLGTALTWMRTATLKLRVLMGEANACARSCSSSGF